MSPRDVQISIDGYERRWKDQMETTRLQCYYIAKFGNSDPKKFPKSVQKFMPLPWDKKQNKSKSKEIVERHERMRKIREELEAKQKLNG